ncbi:MAG: ABC transporter ATP-binding protein, partial [Thermoplasmatales archaeon]
MSDVAIRVENLSKRYKLGPREPYKALRDVISGGVVGAFRRLSSLFNSHRAIDLPRSDNQYIWALKNVSFEIKHGEVVGIIGRNGAGKTTLLKILSRITEPTEGYAEIRGRVGSLLEVGTGFHPELTGRENIYLNGAILGMKKKEIDRKFDEIVAFAELEKFIDTPVKRYSSGMYVRLAFAVAAHLEPEILLVDEVLAVGDAAFQKKCLGKMGDVAKEGRTVLFVSHNMGAIKGLCELGVVLETGKIAFMGSVDSAIDKYMHFVSTINQRQSLRERKDRDGNGQLRFTHLSFYSNGKLTDTLITGEPATIVAEYECGISTELQNVSVSIPFFDYLGQSIFMCWTRLVDQDFEKIPPKGRFIAHIPKFPLREGRYYINLYCEVN